MIQSLHLKNIRALVLCSFIGFLAVSCGTYQSASYYDNDGIYSNGQRVSVDKAPKQVEQQKQQKGENTYADYFGQKADQYSEILESEIFTDVDSYASEVQNDSISEENLTDYYTPDNDYVGNGNWGDNPSNVTINVYDNGWNNWGGFGYGWNNSGWAGAGFGYGFGGYGWGWNRWNRWNRWNNWGWAGYGFGWNNWGWGGYGYAWCPPYGYGFNNRGFGNRGYGYAYNAGRRGYYNRNTVSRNNGFAARSSRSNLNTSRANSSRYRTSSGMSIANRNAITRSTRTSRNGIASRRTVGVDRNQAYRTSRSTRATPRYNRSSRNNQYYSRSAPRSSSYRGGSTVYRSSRSTTPRTSSYRSSRSRTGNTGAYRSSRSTQSYRSSAPRSSSYRSSGRSSSSRSSGSYRSSGSSSRSSGSVRSSSSSSRSSSSGRSSGRSSSSRRQ